MKTICLTLIVIVGTAAAETPEDRLKQSLEERAVSARAASLTTDGRIDFYRGLVTSQPARTRYKVLLAAAFLQKMRETTDFGYVSRASKILDEVLGAEPANYDALTLRAQVQLEYHQFTDAVATARRLIELAPHDPLNYGALGDALMEIGDYEQAGEAIQKMVDLRPDLASYNRAAHFRFLNGDAKGAIDIMRRAVSAGSSAPENVAWCLVELGDMEFKTGQFEQARAAYEYALQTFPRSHKAWAALARLEAAKGETKAAIANYIRAQSITPLPDYAAALYDLYSAAGQTAEAKRQLETVDIIDQLAVANNEKINRNLSIILSDHGWRLDRALQLAKAELDSRRDVYTYDALAWALFKNSDLEEASKAIAKALKLGTPEPQFYYHAGLIARASGDESTAASYFSKAAALNPLWPGVARVQRSSIRISALE